MKRCAPIVVCQPNSKYRTFNGSCNNLRIPTWGAANTPFIRLLNAEYRDGKCHTWLGAGMCCFFKIEIFPHANV